MSSRSRSVRSLMSHGRSAVLPLLSVSMSVACAPEPASFEGATAKAAVSGAERPEQQRARRSAKGRTKQRAAACGALVPPEEYAYCSSCDEAGLSSCQANGCYNGWWCDTDALRCQAPLDPSSCSPEDTNGGSRPPGQISNGGQTPPQQVADAGTDTDDGNPTRDKCTGDFGQALNQEFGRIDGYLVSIVPAGGPKACNGDSRHLHLQVSMQGSVYDVAVNLDTLQLQQSIALPDGAWSEGWHTSDGLDYTQLGLDASSFTAPSPDSGTALQDFLASANHISVFATGYGPTGVHDVHRHGGNDGAIVVEPLSPTPRVMFFRFTTDRF